MDGRSKFLKHCSSATITAIAIIYLDDGIVAVKGKDAAIEESSHIKYELEAAGFMINIEKSMWDLCNCLEWLGFQIDLCEGELKYHNVNLTNLEFNFVK